jgi:co-chaperonin GroES (HSP10)
MLVTLLAAIILFAVRGNSFSILGPGRVSSGVRLQRAGFHPHKLSLNGVAGIDVPSDISKLQAINDFILVERIQPPDRTESGLFVPLAENSNTLRIAKVLSVPTRSTTAEKTSEPTVSTLKVGDVVYVKVSPQQVFCPRYSVGASINCDFSRLNLGSVGCRSTRHGGWIEVLFIS